MCGIPEAMAALQIMQAVGGFQADKQQSKAQEAANARAAESANIAYLNDIQGIEMERGLAAREKSLADFTQKQASKKAEATALNAGFGNAINIIKEIGSKQDLQYIETKNEFDFDMLKLNTQSANSYTALQRNLNKLPPVAKPSPLALGLQIATAGGGYLGVDASDRKYLKDYGKGA
jgi:hypothetical protein